MGSPDTMLRCALTAAALGLLAACADDLDASPLAESTASEPTATTAADDAISPISTVVGTTIRESRVVPLPCIPSRSDPVGVFITLDIVDAALDADDFTLSLRTVDTRLGSHPSGCRLPDLALGQSVFLLGPDDESILTDRVTSRDGVTTLRFALGGRDPGTLAAVLLPTLSYLTGDDTPMTSVYGLVGVWSLV